MSSINKKIAVGAIWMVMLRLCMKGISIVSTFILVRLLSPSDFGLMAMASSIMALIDLIRMFGFDIALIKNQEASEPEYNTAWTMGVIFSLIASVFTISFSGMASAYYQDERLEDVLKIMALTFVISGLNNVGAIEFRKQLKFNIEFKFQLLSKLSGFFATVFLAWYLRSYWALLIGTLVNNIASLALSYALQSYRPKATLIAWKKMLGFSTWLMLNNFIFFVLQNAQNFILGRLAGSGVLGIYSISNEVASIAHSEVIAPINRAAYPGYSKIADDFAALQTTYIKLFQYIALISLPCGVGIAAIAPVLVPVLLGQKWMEAVSIIQIISLSSIFLALSSNATYIFLALGKQHINTVSLLLKLATLIPLLWLFSGKYGGEGAAYSMFAAILVEFFIVFLFIKYILKIKFVSLILAIYRPLLSSAVMFFAVSFISVNYGFIYMSHYGLPWLVGLIFLGVITFIATIFFLCIPYWTKDCVEISTLRKILSFLKKRA